MSGGGEGGGGGRGGGASGGGGAGGRSGGAWGGSKYGTAEVVTATPPNQKNDILQVPSIKKPASDGR